MLSIPRGTHDLFGSKIQKINHICSVLENTVKSYGYGEIKTPIFEHVDTFTYNDESNVSANKELFYLKNEKYTLRPENTASIVRATLTNNLLESNNHENLKFFYFGPMFRYERPQAGRYREFLQFGVENINAKNILNDIETIFMVESLLTRLNLSLKLRLNYLGNQEQKNTWNNSLTEYFTQHKDKLPEASYMKIDKNPLRILDENAENQCTKDAPKIFQFLNDEQKAEISSIKEHLQELKVSYVWDENLVRGIDYYTGLVYEWEYNGQAIISGGRYDELFTKFLPQKSVPCLGFALGLERLLEALNSENYVWNIRNNNVIYIAYLLDSGDSLNKTHIDKKIFDLSERLRQNGFVVLTNWDKSKLKEHFKYSNKKDSDYLLIFGNEEKSKNEIVFKYQKRIEQAGDTQQNNKIQISLSLDNLDNLITTIKQLITQVD